MTGLLSTCCLVGAQVHSRQTERLRHSDPLTAREAGDLQTGSYLLAGRTTWVQVWEAPRRVPPGPRKGIQAPGVSPYGAP